MRFQRYLKLGSDLANIPSKFNMISIWTLSYQTSIPQKKSALFFMTTIDSLVRNLLGIKDWSQWKTNLNRLHCGLKKCKSHFKRQSNQTSSNSIPLKKYSVFHLARSALLSLEKSMSYRCNVCHFIPDGWSCIAVVLSVFPLFTVK